MSNILEEIERMAEYLKKFDRYEIWITSHLPYQDKDDKTIHVLEVDLDKVKESFSADMRIGIQMDLIKPKMPGSNKIVLISEKYFREHKEEIRDSNIPAFAGDTRIN